MRPPLYLEQRIALVRKALNERSMEFQRALPQELQAAFCRLVHECMTTLDGFGSEYGGLESEP